MLTAARFSFPAKTSELEALGQFIASHCQDSKRVLIELAITEVVVNAIKHGQASRITVEIEDVGEEFKLIVSDDGSPFNPTQQKALPMGELREGGYGLGIVEQVSSYCGYQFQEGHNYLTLHFSKGDLS
ncbi:MAG: ATP-binding protein [Trueperaceae bacterium]|nr:ATP-binding protein [Trueperaceae bacterium]